MGFKAAAGQLFAPVLTLGIFFGGPIAKLTRQTMLDILQGDFIRYGRACGLSDWTIASYAFRGILPPVVTLIGWLYAFLVGGAVLVETVFSWNGIGQYAVQSIVNKDYAPVQAFVLLAGLFSLFVYLVSTCSTCWSTRGCACSALDARTNLTALRLLPRSIFAPIRAPCSARS